MNNEHTENRCFLIQVYFQITLFNIYGDGEDDGDGDGDATLK